MGLAHTLTRIIIIKLGSISLAFWAASLSVVIALIFTLFKRLSTDQHPYLPVQISGLGYTIPRTV